MPRPRDSDFRRSSCPETRHPSGGGRSPVEEHTMPRTPEAAPASRRSGRSFRAVSDGAGSALRPNRTRRRFAAYRECLQGARRSADRRVASRPGAERSVRCRETALPETATPNGWLQLSDNRSDECEGSNAVPSRGRRRETSCFRDGATASAAPPMKRRSHQARRTPDDSDAETARDASALHSFAETYSHFTRWLIGAARVFTPHGYNRNEGVTNA